MSKKTFTITCTMEERWINQFMSFLKYMEGCGKQGHSCRVGFYSDGDGDFRPIFNADVSWDREEARYNAKIDREYEERDWYDHIYNEVTFDAG